MLSNAYFLAKFRFDTAENEPAKNLQNFAKIANFADPNPLTALKNPVGDARGSRSVVSGSIAMVPAWGHLARSNSGDLQDGQELRLRGRGARLANFRQNVARFRLYRHRSLQLNTRFSAF